MEDSTLHAGGWVIKLLWPGDAATQTHEIPRRCSPWTPSRGPLDLLCQHPMVWCGIREPCSWKTPSTSLAGRVGTGTLALSLSLMGRPLTGYRGTSIWWRQGRGTQWWEFQGRGIDKWWTKLNQAGFWCFFEWNNLRHCSGKHQRLEAGCPAVHKKRKKQFWNTEFILTQTFLTLRISQIWRHRIEEKELFYLSLTCLLLLPNFAAYCCILCCWIQNLR